MSIGKTERIDEVRAELMRACARRGSQRQWAVDHGISPATLNDMIHGRKAVSDQVARMVGFERVTVYRRAACA